MGDRRVLGFAWLALAACLYLVVRDVAQVPVCFCSLVGFGSEAACGALEGLRANCVGGCADGTCRCRSSYLGVSLLREFW